MDPCLTLELDEVYQIAIYDDDSPLTADDYIGEIDFKMENFIAERPSTVTLTNPGQITVTLEFEWD